MVYLLKMVIFHGYVSHNQMVTIKKAAFLSGAIAITRHVTRLLQELTK